MAAETGTAHETTAGPAAGQDAGEAAGAAFFRRRLQRAAAIPPEQRDPVVQAFLTGVQLMDAADALLPLTANGQPALPADTAECQQAEVQAMLLAATASYMAPAAVCWEGQMQDRLGCYVRRRFDLASNSNDAYLSAMQPLAGLLLELSRDSICDPMLVMEALSRASAALAPQSTRDTVNRQLQQARQGTPCPLLQTADQLEAALQAKLLDVAMRVPRTEADDAQPWQMPEAGDIWRFLSSGRKRLLQLDRRNYMALIAVAAVRMASVSYLPPRTDLASNLALLQECTVLQLLAFRSTQAMHSQYWAVIAASRTLLSSDSPVVKVSRADLAALSAVAEHAPAAVKQLRGMLLAPWAASLEAHGKMATAMASTLQLRHSSSSAASSERRAARDRGLECFESLEGRLVCAACGMPALGLRRCARCKLAANCSRECQVRHWPQHKRECKPHGHGA